MARGKFEYWLTEDGLTLLEGWARDGLTEDQIAHDKMHISRSTLSEWKNRFSDIADALKDGKEIPDYKVENALYKAALDGNIAAIIFWLKNRRPDKWRDKPKEDPRTEAIETAMKALADIIQRPAQNRNIEDFEE